MGQNMREIIREYTDYVAKQGGRHERLYDEIISKLAEYVQELKCNKYYSTKKLLQEYAKDEKPLTLVIWDLGSGFIDWKNYLNKNSFLHENPFSIEWYRLDIVYEKDDCKYIQYCWEGKIKFIKVNINLLQSSFDTKAMEGLKEKIGSAWPDIIIAKHFFSRLQFRQEENEENVEERAKDLINFYYHCLEPEGRFILVDIKHDHPSLDSQCSQIGKELQQRKISKQFANYWEQGLKNAKNYKVDKGAKAVFDNHNNQIKTYNNNYNFILIKDKIPNIFMEEIHRKNSPVKREKLINADIRKEFILQCLTKISDMPITRILDVGVGDGRFSKYLFSYVQKRSWEYKGIEILCKNLFERGENRDCEECENYEKEVAYGTNFFNFNSKEKYGAIFLLFMTHLYKHWQVMIYKAKKLLEKGGYLVIGFRDDVFSFWRYGYFVYDNFKSPIRDIFKKYWCLRREKGIRNFEQMNNNICPTDVIRFAEKHGIGFKVHDIVKISKVYNYTVSGEDLVPENKIYWSFSYVGLTKLDKEYLKKEFKCPEISSWLQQSLGAYILKKVRC